MTDPGHGLPASFVCPFEDDIDEINTVKGSIAELIAEQRVNRSILERLEVKADKMNGSVRDLQKNDYTMEGAVGALKWLVGIALSLFGLSIAASSVIVAVIALG